MDSSFPHLKPIAYSRKLNKVGARMTGKKRVIFREGGRKWGWFRENRHESFFPMVPMVP